MFSSSWFTGAASPTLQPARVNGTQGAGVMVSGFGAGLVVAGGLAE